MAPTPSKAVQEAEAGDRAMQRGSANPETPPEGVIETIQPQLDDAPHEPPAPTRRGEEESTGARNVLSPRDAARANIAARFRSTRTASASEADENAEDIRRLMATGAEPEFAEPPVGAVAEPQPAPERAAEEPEPEPAPAPKRKLKVRGQDVELTEEEIIAAAQKGLAGENYLEESRRKLDEVNRLLNDTRSRVARGDPAEHPGERTAQPDATPADPAETHPPGKKLVEAIQYGDPDEAEQLIQQRIDEAAAKKADERLLAERLRNETNRSMRFLKEFRDQNPELSSDENASAVMERRLFDLQREDLVNLAKGQGIDEAQVPNNPAEIANWHRYYRSEGYQVRDVPALLKQTRDDFLAWRGKQVATTPAKSDPSPQPTDAKPAPARVAVNVDRTQRRAVIQPQPSRSVAPKPDAEVAASTPRTREQVLASRFAEMKAVRGKPTVRIASN